MAPKLTLISHHLCPYVQRAVIALTEKGIPFERSYIDLAAKPDWFKRLSPLGKVPLLLIDGTTTLFESAVICEYLDETVAPRLHPDDALERARHRGWIEFGSAILNEIAGLYSAPDAAAFAVKRDTISERFRRLEDALGEGPYFAGARFHLVDAVFAPVFRYFDAFERIDDFGFFTAMPKVAAWRAALAERPSARKAVTADYPERLSTFLKRRGSYLSSRMS